MKPQAIESLTLHQQYPFDQIEAFAIRQKLAKIDGELNGVIGEVVMPLYSSEDPLEREVVANFILTGYSTQSVWRCIYASYTLSSTGQEEI